MTRSAVLLVGTKPAWTSYFFMFPLLFPPRVYLDDAPVPRSMWFRPVRLTVTPGRHRIWTGLGMDEAWIVVEASPNEVTEVTYTTPRTRAGRGRFVVAGGAEIERDDDAL